MEAGKHVYVQKPLTATVHEARMLRELALKNPKLVTQMGNQGHSSEGARLINEWIGAGIIGPVHEVHVWTNRPVVYWPQGLARPTSVPPVEAPGRFRQSLDIPLRAGCARRRHGRRRRAARRDSIGTCIWDRSRRMFPIIRSITPSTGAAGWLLAAGAGRHGRASHRSSLLGVGAHLSHEHRGDLDSVGHHAVPPRSAAARRAGAHRASPCRIRSRLACTINSRPAARSRR